MNNETTKDQVRRLIAGIAPCYEKRPDLIKDDDYCFGFMVQVVELAIAEEREAGGWQPIESAPKGGSHILLGRAGTDEDCEISTLGWWQAEVLDGQDYMGSDAGFVDHEFSSFHPGRSFGDDKYQYKAVQPTHWMPIPAAPKAEVSE